MEIEVVKKNYFSVVSHFSFFSFSSASILSIMMEVLTSMMSNRPRGGIERGGGEGRGRRFGVLRKFFPFVIFFLKFLLA